MRPPLASARPGRWYRPVALLMTVWGGTVTAGLLVVLGDPGGLLPRVPEPRLRAACLVLAGAALLTARGLRMLGRVREWRVYDRHGR